MRIATAMLVQLCSVVLILGITLSGCVQYAPPELLAAIESLDRQLVETRAAEFAPEDYAQFVKHWLMVKARLQADEDVIRWPWEPNPLVAELRKLEEEGTRAAEAAAQKKTAEREDADARLAVLEQRARSFAVRVNEMGSRVVLGQKPVETELLVKQARSYFDQGLYARSVQTGQQAARLIEDQAVILSNELGRYADERSVDIWRQMVKRTVDWSRAHRAAAIVVNKADRRLILYRNGRVMASYPIRLGYNGILEKRYQGDGATPEGMYRVIRKRDRGHTTYYKALLLDYPNSEDHRRFQAARNAGVIPAKALIGGQIEIHGEDSLSMSQTLGCIMLDNRHIDALFKVMDVGSPVTIVGAVNVSNAIAMGLAEIGQSEES
jgi:lipoprotein-anchoring transpeptidase ErfK/SrfK